VNNNFLSQEEIDALLNAPELLNNSGESNQDDEKASFPAENGNNSHE